MSKPGQDWLAEGRVRRWLTAGAIALAVAVGVAAMFYGFFRPDDPDLRLTVHALVRLVAVPALLAGAGTWWLASGILRMRAARRAFDAEEARKRAGRPAV